VVLFGREFWEKLIDFDLMVAWGVISAQDLRLFRVVDTVEEAFTFLTGALNDLHDLD
jgi:predicted Rossmann-fold nucleotide-binding protein